MRSSPRLALLVLCSAMVMHFGQGVLAADDPLPTGGLLVHAGCGAGGRTVFSTDDGKKLSSMDLAGACAWDGMAAAYGRLYVSMRDGRLVCLGDPRMPPPPFPTRAQTKQ